MKENAALDRAQLRNIVGHMPEQVRWQGKQTVEDALLELAEMRGKSIKRVKDLLRLVGLSQRSETPLSGLSQGMRQRLTLAAALLGSPKFLLLDEPLNGLDPVAATAFIRLLHQLKEKGVSIIISSHQVHGLEAITDRIALMHRGQLLACGSLESIAESLDLTTTIEVKGTGEMPKLDWCKDIIETSKNNQGWMVSLHASSADQLSEFIQQGVEVTSWAPKSPGIVEMLCAATGMDLDEVSLEIASAAMLPHRSLRGEEE
jgi:ABC-type multidrug transport system ATPase subunit